jgi:hypothetical protein
VLRGCPPAGGARLWLWEIGPRAVLLGVAGRTGSQAITYRGGVLLLSPARSPHACTICQSLLLHCYCAKHRQELAPLLLTETYNSKAKKIRNKAVVWPLAAGLLLAANAVACTPQVASAISGWPVLAAWLRAHAAVLT